MILYSMYSGGSNSAKINMVFDMVAHDQVSDALAFSQAVSGVVGFGATLLVSPLVSMIRKTETPSSEFPCMPSRCCPCWR